MRRRTSRRAAAGLVIAALLPPLGACRAEPPATGPTGPDPLGGVEATLDVIERDLVAEGVG